jgi:hypothetical protein
MTRLTLPPAHFHTCHSCGGHWEHRPHPGRCSLPKVALCDRCVLGSRDARNRCVHPGYLEHPNPNGD